MNQTSRPGSTPEIHYNQREPTYRYTLQIHNTDSGTAPHNPPPHTLRRLSSNQNSPPQPTPSPTTTIPYQALSLNHKTAYLLSCTTTLPRFSQTSFNLPPSTSSHFLLTLTPPSQPLYNPTLSVICQDSADAAEAGAVDAAVAAAPPWAEVGAEAGAAAAVMAAAATAAAAEAGVEAVVEAVMEAGVAAVGEAGAGVMEAVVEAGGGLAA